MSGRASFDTSKPYKGRIDQWAMVNTGYGPVVYGADPQLDLFKGERLLRTSIVVRRKGDWIETRNSLYRLGACQ